MTVLGGAMATVFGLCDCSHTFVSDRGRQFLKGERGNVKCARGRMETEVVVSWGADDAAYAPTNPFCIENAWVGGRLTGLTGGGKPAHRGGADDQSPGFRSPLRGGVPEHCWVGGLESLRAGPGERWDKISRPPIFTGTRTSSYNLLRAN